MGSWTNLILKTAAGVEERLDRWRYKRRARRRDGAVIVPYRGFGTSNEIFLKGRVLEEKQLAPASDTRRVFHNLRAMYRRFESDEVPFARIAAAVHEHRIEVVADDEGYFDIRMPIVRQSDSGASDHRWLPVELSLLEPRTDADALHQTTGSALVPHAQASFGVISDIDDTILITNATQRLQMLRTTLFGNARTRLPFPGVSELYRALHRGADDAPNPIFYLSSSPWNLYDFLTEFMEIHQLPRGPLLLRDIGIDRTKFLKSSHESHKLAQIQHLMMTFPDLPFILIGDSGQHDPEIYRMAVEHFPERVPAVYIRDVSGSRRDDEVRALARAVRHCGGEMIVARDSRAIAEHAAKKGFVDPVAARHLLDAR